MSSNGLNTGRWQKDEQERFVAAMAEHGMCKPTPWALVAEAVRTRTVVQCRTHAQKVWNTATNTLQTAANRNSASSSRTGTIGGARNSSGSSGSSVSAKKAGRKRGRE